jgi:serine/threonine protein kinase
MLLNNRHLLQEPIGRGGLATIDRGWDTYLERVVAVKLLREVYCTNPSVVRRFQYDAELRYSLKHPNIVQVYDYGYSNGNYYMVMELIESIDLRCYLGSRGTIDTDLAIMIANNVALGLGTAHSLGIVHRNLNALHILMGHDG